jgi:AraC family transcriptional regulator
VLPALVALIENREGIPPSLPALAEQLDLSERQTSRLFRQQMGLSFREYAARLRVERATKLLAETHRPVTEIALSSGWNSPSQFNFAFRKQIGMTPGAYRLGRQKERENSIENE